MYLLTQTKCGISAKQLQRQLGVTYKTAWSMAHKIRELMDTSPDELLQGIVEIDETYVGGNAKNNFRVKNWEEIEKVPVMGLVQRKGIAVLRHLSDGVGGVALIEVIEKYVDKRAYIMTDQLSAYMRLKKKGYKHDWVMHRKQFVKGDNIHTQNVENVWSHFKRGIKGVYRSVSSKHMQKYANEFAFRYSYRNEDIFDKLILRISTFQYIT